MSTKMKMCVSYRVILGLLLTLTATIVQSCTMKKVVRNEHIPWDPASESIAIRTNSEIGTEERVEVRFYDDNNNSAGSVFVKFASPIEYKLGYCNESYTTFPVTPPTRAEKIWRIDYNYTELRVVYHCNELEVLNVVLSDSVCDLNNTDIVNWRTYWQKDREPTKIMFFAPTDTASDMYCVGRGDPVVVECTGLDPAWTYLTTETTFPVFQGTGVEVSCDEGYGLVGSSTVSCNKDTTFTYDKQPSCIRLGVECTGLDPGWTNLTTKTTFPVFQGTGVKVTCDKGYGLVGSSTVTCNKGSTFKYNNRPSCRRLDCTGLDPAWTYLMTETMFPMFQGTVVEVSCEEGYGLVGSSTVICNKDTTFTFNNQPSCRQLRSEAPYNYTPWLIGGFTALVVLDLVVIIPMFVVIVVVLKRRGMLSFRGVSFLMCNNPGQPNS